MDNKRIIGLMVIVILIAVTGMAVFNAFMLKTDSALNVTSSNELNNGENFSISLKDAKGNPLVNQVVTVTLVDANGFENHQEVTTDKSGNGMFQLNNLKSGKYEFNVVYGGDNGHNGCNMTQKVSVGR